MQGLRGGARRGELYPCETDVRLCEELETGQEVEVDMEADVLTVLSTGQKYPLKPIGDVSCAASMHAPSLQRLNILHMWHGLSSRTCSAPSW